MAIGVPYAVELTSEVFREARANLKDLPLGTQVTLIEPWDTRASEFEYTTITSQDLGTIIDEHGRRRVRFVVDGWTILLTEDEVVRAGFQVCE